MQVERSGGADDVVCPSIYGVAPGNRCPKPNKLPDCPHAASLGNLLTEGGDLI